MSASSMANIRVLVADDNTNFRRIICDLLQHEGFEVRDAADSDALLAVALAQRPDVIVADARLLGRGPLAVLRALRKANLDSEMILVSGLLDDRTRAEAESLDVRWMLEKPFTLDALLTTLHAAMQR